MQSTLLEGLNTEQLTAVTHTGGPLLIVAGAGTGKTTVITRKIAYLLEQQLAQPDEILALTFTEKAASEMEERVELLMPLGYTDFWISTFHAFCERILKLHGLEIGLPNDFELLDETRQWILLYNNIDALPLDYFRPMGSPNKFISSLLQHISRCKDELVTPEDYLAYAQSLSLAGGSAELIPSEENITEQARIGELADLYHAYQKLLLDNNYLDFGDLIFYTIRLFKQRPNILRFYQKKFKHILVDEFQDTNYAQYELIKLLSGQSPTVNLAVVGDDDQSIYKFRGASVSNILQFKQDYPTLSQVTLTTNYRSSQEILDVSYTLISHNNPERLEVKLGIDKHLHNPHSEPGIIQVLEGADLSEEIRLVVEKILELKNAAPDTSWNNFAILIRSRSASEELLPKLDAAGIPFTYIANTGLYRKPIIANIIAFCRLLYNMHESENVYRTLNFPKFRLPAQTVARFVQYAGKHTVSLFEALHVSTVLDAVEDEQSKVRVQALLETIQRHSAMAQERTAVEVIVTVIKDLDVAQLLEEETLENAQNRELLEQFYKHVEEFEHDKAFADKSLKSFLQALELELRAGFDGAIDFDPNSGPESVKVLTVHAAKGLEFENVFVINLVDQRFPTREKSTAIEIPDALIKDILPEGDFHLQEERRLFYVAITRAKRRLYVSWAKNYGGARLKKPSIFLQETGLVPSEAVSRATGKVIFTKPVSTPKQQVYFDIPKVFSYSSIQTFLNCPLEYKYLHYLKLPLPGSAALSFGKTIHATLQKYLELFIARQQSAQADLFGKKTAPGLPSFEELVTAYESCWVDEWYPTKRSKAEHRQKGKEFLKNFFEYSSTHIPQAKYLEKKFNLPLGEFIFTGKIDRVDATDTGVTIIDYKTGVQKKKKSYEDVDQLRIYQWACETEFKETVVGLHYWYLEQGEQGFVPMSVASGEELAQLQARLLETIQTICDAIRYDRFAEIHTKHQMCNFEDYV